MKEQAEELPESAGPSEHDIADRIVAAVMEQRLAPGFKLSEPKLCETFGVGRMRVRRALLLLANQGVVSLHSNRGAFIAGPDAAEARDVFQTRAMLEAGIVRKAALCATAEDIERLRQHIALEAVARERRDRRAAIRLSGEFHIKLAQACGNRVATKILRELVARSSLIIGLFGAHGSPFCEEHEHADMVAAIEARDPEAAEALMRRHIGHIETDLDLSPSPEGEGDLMELLRSS